MSTGLLVFLLFCGYWRLAKLSQMQVHLLVYHLYHILTSLPTLTHKPYFTKIVSLKSFTYELVYKKTKYIFIWLFTDTVPLTLQRIFVHFLSAVVELDQYPCRVQILRCRDEACGIDAVWYSMHYTFIFFTTKNFVDSLKSIKWWIDTKCLTSNSEKKIITKYIYYLFFLCFKKKGGANIIISNILGPILNSLYFQKNKIFYSSYFVK